MTQHHGHVSLGVVGDVMLGRLMNETISSEGPVYPWGNVLPLLKSSDLLLVNLECAITRNEKRWQNGAEKDFYFRGDPSVVEVLQTAGVNFASLANNHIFDFRAEGLLETLRILDKSGIAHAGAGENAADAARPCVLESEGLRVGVLAYADYPEAWRAGGDSPGLNYIPLSVEPNDFYSIERAISSLRPDVDFVVFSIHWGPNMRERPTPEFQDFAHAVIDAGADLFWGHSAHLLHGIELYHDRLILYDTGDFVDDYAVDSELRNDLSALFRVDICRNGIAGLNVVPVRIENMQVNLAVGEDRQWILDRLNELSGELGTNFQDGVLRIAACPA